MKQKCEDGINRTYLVVDGLVWSKINGSEIFTTYGLKKASMELSEDNLSYHFDKEGHCVFDSVSFLWDYGTWRKCYTCDDRCEY